MASLDPLKSVISINNVDDTSLAMPSGNQFKTGQDRVLQQVQTIRRTKSRHSSTRSGSTSLSPTSPAYYDSVFTDSSKSSAANGSVFFGNGFSKALSLERNGSRQVVNNNKGSPVKMSTAASNYQYDRILGASAAGAVGKPNTSRSEPDLAWQNSMAKRSQSQKLLSNMNLYGVEKTKKQYVKGSMYQNHIQTQSTPQVQNLPRYQSQIPPLSPTQFQTMTLSKSQPGFSVVDGTGMTRSSTKIVTTKVETVKTTPKSPDTTKSTCFIQQPVTTVTPKEDSGLNGNGGVADITMKEAVEYLSNSDETYQHCGASFIQHSTFMDDKSKDEVLKYSGIPPLVSLLRSPSTQVNQTASAALRNLSFKNNSSKEEMNRCGGITEAVALLRETDSPETQKQLTGLLWNLSSVDSLKPDLLKCALPVLMERVILPYTTGPERTNIEPEAFFHATACLRNISSAKQSNRQAMRKCRGLVDSLVSYVSDCVEAGRPNDKSLENCVCILHNLTFQLEDEAPALFGRITALAKNVIKNQNTSEPGPIGCFSPQGKSPEQERHFDFPVVEDPQPSGAGWLIHSKTLQSYLSLLATSEREETQEACCGAMQNLTAQEGIVSGAMSQIVVQKLNGLKVITPLLKSNRINLQRSSVALARNLIRNPNLHNTLARKALPELLSIVSAGTKGGNESDDTLAMACHTSNVLLMKDPEMGKHLLSPKLIASLNDLSQNEYFPKTKKAASVLLYNLWSEKDLQSFLKKQGMTKASFVNDVTTAVHKSLQVVD
ncbi:plakophilin-1-like [Halichoeres trimaculatus]|uniref:plakophilin-1-like n=1 Tax=Halichoeres trimaculatus TaxID=147232 RepID=UPI003D9EDCDA